MMAVVIGGVVICNTEEGSHTSSQVVSFLSLVMNRQAESMYECYVDRLSLVKSGGTDE